MIAVWNAYASGFNYEFIKALRMERYGLSLEAVEELVHISSVVGLVSAFVGTAYVLAIVIGYFAARLTHISAEALKELLAYNFWIFCGLITVFGIVITVESMIIAAETRDAWSIINSIWDNVVSIWEDLMHIRHLFAIKDIINSSSDDDDDDGRIYLVVILAAVTATIVVYSAFVLGRRSARRAFRELFPSVH